MGAMKNLSLGGRSGGRGGISFIPKDMFFDRDAVTRQMDKATAKAMKKSGRNIRTTARRSMRYVKTMDLQREEQIAGRRKRDPRPYRPSMQGKPPVAVKPHPWLRKHLYYSYDRHKQTLVVGPQGFRSAAKTPHNLEFGGRVFIKNKLRTLRKIGDGGEVRLGGLGPTAKLTRTASGITQVVTYAKLRSAAQVTRANKLNEFLYGPDGKTVSMAARPFMGPALEAEIPDIPGLWHNSLRGI